MIYYNIENSFNQFNFRNLLVNDYVIAEILVRVLYFFNGLKNFCIEDSLNFFFQNVCPFLCVVRFNIEDRKRKGNKNKAVDCVRIGGI